jgi:hypothetical protein
VFGRALDKVVSMTYLIGLILVTATYSTVTLITPTVANGIMLTVVCIGMHSRHKPNRRIRNPYAKTVLPLAPAAASERCTSGTTPTACHDVIKVTVL